jgi:hypothetical protein
MTEPTALRNPIARLDRDLRARLDASAPPTSDDDEDAEWEELKQTPADMVFREDGTLGAP